MAPSFWTESRIRAEFPRFEGTDGAQIGYCIGSEFVPRVGAISFTISVRSIGRHPGSGHLRGLVMRRSNLFCAILMAGLATAFSSSLLNADEKKANDKTLIGRSIDNFTLQDFYGKNHSLSDYADSKLVVVAFVGTECPLAKLYAPRLQAMSEEFGKQGATFLCINSNRQDSITEISSYARRHNLEVPILKDVSNDVAEHFGATRTPEIFVLDADRKVRYHGRIDAQYGFGYGVGYAKPKLDRRDLGVAVEELLAGKEVSLATTEVRGCLIGKARQPDADSKVTYTNQIARIFQKRCIECHREGQIAPFALMEYEEVAGWGEMIAEVVDEQRMPPWHANPEHGVFANENLLSQNEKELINTWVEAGCPEGDKANLPEPRQFADNWFMPQQPDMVINMRDEPFEVPAEGVVDYQNFVVDPGFTEDKWIKMAECMPGNRKVVHHIVVFVLPPQPTASQVAKRGAGKARRGKRSSQGGVDPTRGFNLLEGYAPGTRPMVYPRGMAKKIRAGSKLVFQLHYTPCGSPQTDISKMGLMFVDEDEEITHEVATTNTGTTKFLIPAGDDNYRVDARKTLDRDTLMLSYYPHMHLRGKSMKYDVTYPDGKNETLVDVPIYDFNWQVYYILAEPKLLPEGTEMHVTAYYDNSENNLANPNPAEDIDYGDQTFDEMMFGWYTAAFPVAKAE
jgi:peroxiredoxin